MKTHSERPVPPRLELSKAKVRLPDEVTATARSPERGRTTFTVTASGTTLSIAPAPRQLLLALLRPRSQVFLPDGFVVFQRWRGSSPPQDPLGAFRKVAWGVEEALKDLPGVDIQIVTSGKDQGYSWQLVTNADSDVADAAEWLSGLMESRRDAKCPEFERQLWHGLSDRLHLLDQTRVAEAILLTASASNDGRITQKLRTAIRRSLRDHSLALAGGVTALVCYAHMKPELFSWDRVRHFVRQWVSDLGCVAEAIHATKDTRSLGMAPVSCDEVDEFVVHANTYRGHVLGALRQRIDHGTVAKGFRKEGGRLEAYDPPVAALGEREDSTSPSLTDGQLREKIEETIFYRRLAADILRTLPRGSARIPESTVNHAVLEELCAWLTWQPRPLIALPGLLPLISSAVCAAVRRNLDGEDPPTRRDIPPGPRKLAMTVVSLLDGVARPSDAQRTVNEVLNAVAPFGQSVVVPAPAPRPEVSDVQLRTLLIEDARHGLMDKLGTDDLNAYVPLRLSEYTALHDVEPSLTASLPGTQPLPSVWQPVHEEQLIPPAATHLFCAPSGAGKTTLCRHLQWLINSETDKLAVYIEVDDLDRDAVAPQSSLLDRAAYRLDPLRNHGDLGRALEHAAKERRLVLIIDTRDHLADASLCELVRRLDRDCHLLVSGWHEALQAAAETLGVPLLRIEPFDEADQRQFFGANYDRASGLVQECQDFLRIPMYAYLLRRMAQGDTATLITSLWSLFTAFVTYVLRVQAAFPRDSRHGRSLAAETLLQAVAYGAIDRSPACLERIGHSLWSQFVTDPRALDDAVSTGFVRLVPDHTRQGQDSFVFAHQKFQEYFAAAWACRDEARVQHVLSEYWNPKWRGIITFLSGCEGPRVADDIYRDGRDDDAIHTRLFLACECAGQADVTPERESTLLGEVAPLTAQGHFLRDAMIAMVALQTNRAHDLAWSILVDDVDRTVHLDHTPVVPTLATFERQRSLRNQLGGPHSLLALRLLAECSAQLPSQSIEVVITLMGSEDAAIRAQARNVLYGTRAQLEPSHIRRIVEYLSHDDSLLKSNALLLLADLASSLGDDDVWDIVRCVNDANREVVEAAAHALSHLALRRAHADYVRRVLLSGAQWPFCCVCHRASNLARYWTADELDEVIGGPVDVSSVDSTLRWRDALSLVAGADRLSDRRMRLVFQAAETSVLRAPALRTLAQFHDQLPRDTCTQILDIICTDDADLLRVAENAMCRLLPYVEQQHVSAIVYEATSSQRWWDTKIHALGACAHLLDRLDQGEIQRLIGELCLIPESCCPRAKLHHLCLAIRQRLTAERTRALVKKVLQQGDRKSLLAVLEIVDGRHLTGDLVAQVVPLLAECYFARSAHRVIREAHEAGMWR